MKTIGSDISVVEDTPPVYFQPIKKARAEGITCQLVIRVQPIKSEDVFLFFSSFAGVIKNEECVI
jgi:hypothetical protein